MVRKNYSGEAAAEYKMGEGESGINELQYEEERAFRGETRRGEKGKARCVRVLCCRVTGRAPGV